MHPEIPMGYLSLGDWDLKQILQCSQTLPLVVLVMEGTCEVFVPIEKEDRAIQLLQKAQTLEALRPSPVDFKPPRGWPGPRR